MDKEFIYKGKTYRMEPDPKGTLASQVCQGCPLQRPCGDYEEVGILIDLKGGFCDTLNAHPVLVENLVQEQKILLKKTGPFRNLNEENDWNEVLVIAKSWGWIQS